MIILNFGAYSSYLLDVLIFLEDTVNANCKMKCKRFLYIGKDTECFLMQKQI